IYSYTIKHLSMGSVRMEEVIKKSIEIEHDAQNLVAEGLAKKEDIRIQTEDELRDMEANILEMAEHKIEQLRARSRKEADDRVIRIYEDTALKMRLMEESAEEHQTNWEDQIFNRIIGR
ncbi:MAG: hypothetical protein N2376_09025, partial [Clostridia bacterium]|nr:hypothetical protein [Clostridia bacterium]